MSNSNNDYLKLNECVKGSVYKLKSRNLSVGVFDGKDSFIGIRTKFDRRFLDSEGHWDNSSFATAKPLLEIGYVPDDISLSIVLKTIDSRNDREVDYDKGWYYLDTGEYDKNINPVNIRNKELFEFLEQFENDE